MKRTLTINLNQQVFHINDDAFEMLSDYLTTLRAVFRNDTEITDDIECRIGEIFSEMTSGNKPVITIDDVEHVITQIGSPDEISGNEVSLHDRENTKKRLFRNPAGKMVSGVCAGLAAYFDIDPVWIRIIAILLFCVTIPITLIAYIAMWILLPVADTTQTRMAMSGKSPTLENIAQTVTRQYNNARNYIQSPQSKSALYKVSKTVTKIGAQLFKIFLGITALLFILEIIACSLLSIGSTVILVKQLYDPSFAMEVMTAVSSEATFPLSMPGSFIPLMLFILGVSVTICITLTSILILIYNATRSQPLLYNKTTRITVLVALIISIAITITGLIGLAINNTSIIASTLV